MFISRLDTSKLSDHSLQKLINMLVNESSKRSAIKLAKERKLK